MKVLFCMRMDKTPIFSKLLLVALLTTPWFFACKPEISQYPTVIVSTTTQQSAGKMLNPLPQTTVLPTPHLKGPLTLEETLMKRRSIRQFADTPLTQEEIGQLLWATQGITHPAGLRTAPSAGALYPLEVYLITSEGVYHYDPSGHRLLLHKRGDLRPELHIAALRQEPVLNAPAVFIIAAEYERTEKKYGKERSPRYVHLEAGHAAQNLLLQAVALNLGAVPIGAFIDDQVKEAVSLPGKFQPLYLIPVGHPD